MHARTHNEKKEATNIKEIKKGFGGRIKGEEREETNRNDFMISRIRDKL